MTTATEGVKKKKRKKEKKNPKNLQNESKHKNIVNKTKDTVEGMNSRVRDTEKYTHYLGFRILEIKQNSKKKSNFKNGNSLKDI